MGRIKTKLSKRTSRELIAKSPESFGKEFEGNKKALGSTMPSKRLRNIIAGYVTRLKKAEKKLIQTE
jgi:small subunit ribosomal protein S17e